MAHLGQARLDLVNQKALMSSVDRLAQAEELAQQAVYGLRDIRFFTIL